MLVRFQYFSHHFITSTFVPQEISVRARIVRPWTRACRVHRLPRQRGGACLVFFLLNVRPEKPQFPGRQNLRRLPLVVANDCTIVATDCGVANARLTRSVTKRGGIKSVNSSVGRQKKM